MYKVFKYSTPCCDLSLGRGWLYRGAKNVIIFGDRKLLKGKKLKKNSITNVKSIENTLLRLIMTLSISLENEFFILLSSYMGTQQ